jgi:hypothetical protein
MTTRKPKTECGITLKYLANEFIKDRWTGQGFKTTYNQIKKDFKGFLNQKSENNQFQLKQLRSTMGGDTITPTLLVYNYELPSVKYP